jgi:hypothetical protein
MKSNRVRLVDGTEFDGDEFERFCWPTTRFLTGGLPTPNACALPSDWKTLLTGRKFNIRSDADFYSRRGFLQSLRISEIV